ncbi:MAG: class I SAM-dependent methyltransferase [Thiotrichales bacterium]
MGYWSRLRQRIKKRHQQEKIVVESGSNLPESKVSTGSNDIRRVQVGCGPHNLLEQWWNVDIRSFPGIDQAMDVAEPWPWRNQLEYVYGEHFLEHLTLEQAILFLNYSGVALKVGGKIRLTTPSLEWVLKTHFDFSQTEAIQRVDDTFKTNRAFHGWGHQFLYSREMLAQLLQALGFEQIEWCDFGHSKDPNLNNLERHGSVTYAEGFPSVWIVEATKTSIDLKQDKDFLNELDSSYLKYVRSGH